MSVSCQLFAAGIDTSSVRPPAFGTSARPAATDSFRNRPLNTSRPPSMHVDQYMRIEHSERVICINVYSAIGPYVQTSTDKARARSGDRRSSSRRSDEKR